MKKILIISFLVLLANGLTSCVKTNTAGIIRAQENGMSLRELESHNSAQDCYIAVDGEVYDFSDFSALHPGGSQAIESNCGKDATNIFFGKHGPQQWEKLKEFHIAHLSE